MFYHVFHVHLFTPSLSPPLSPRDCCCCACFTYTLSTRRLQPLLFRCPFLLCHLFPRRARRACEETFQSWPRDKELWNSCASCSGGRARFLRRAQRKSWCTMRFFRRLKDIYHRLYALARKGGEIKVSYVRAVQSFAPRASAFLLRRALVLYFFDTVRIRASSSRFFVKWKSVKNSWKIQEAISHGHNVKTASKMCTF